MMNRPNRNDRLDAQALSANEFSRLATGETPADRDANRRRRFIPQQRDSAGSRLQSNSFALPEEDDLEGPRYCEERRSSGRRLGDGATGSIGPYRPTSADTVVDSRGRKADARTRLAVNAAPHGQRKPEMRSGRCTVKCRREVDALMNRNELH